MSLIVKALAEAAGVEPMDAADLDDALLEDEEVTAALRTVDPRPLHELENARGAPRLPLRPLTTAIHGSTLSEEERRRFAKDLLLLLGLFHDVIVSPLGRQAVFDHEREALGAIRNAADELRKVRGHYERARNQLNTLLELRDIYQQTVDDWRSSSAKNRRTKKRVELEQLQALKKFISRHQLKATPLDLLREPEEILAEASSDDLAEGEVDFGGQGAQKTASAALAPLVKLSPRTLESLRERSNLERARVSTFSDFCPKRFDAWSTFDDGVRTLSSMFETVTDTAWPKPIADLQPHGWGRVRAELGAVLTKLGKDRQQARRLETAPPWQTPRQYVLDQTAIQLLRSILRPHLR